MRLAPYGAQPCWRWVPVLGNHDTYGPGDLVRAEPAARDAMVVLGQAAPGDKTILDVVLPFVATLEEGDRPEQRGSGSPGNRGRIGHVGGRSNGTASAPERQSAPLGGPERRDA